VIDHDDAAAAASSAPRVPEQVAVRLAKREELLKRGDAYAVRPTITHALADIRSAHDGLPPGTMTGEQVSIAGRVMFLRNTGKLCFATLQAGEGTTLQAMLAQDRVGPQSLEDFKHLVDIGDHIVVAGEVGTSRRGELSVFAQSWSMAAKALRPLPVAHKELAEDTRVRQRYVDLIMRPAARRTARRRIEAVGSLRRSLTARGYCEVETPVLQALHGGAAARPFITHMNAFDMELYLRIAPELFLKRCVVGGIERVFDLNRNFRNEGSDSTHSPEFSMLEFYQAYADYRDMAALTRELIQEAALAVHGDLRFRHDDGTEHDLSGTWDEISLFPALSAAAGQQIGPDTPVAQLQEMAQAAGVAFDPGWIHGKLAEELFEHFVVARLQRPTFVFDYPVDTSPLVREHRSEPGVVEKWDLYINGYELATGYSELVDPVIQRERLTAQSLLKAAGDPEAMQVDEDFLRALEYGMPPCGGVGVGVDRLLMTLTGLGIRETILFPLVKPIRQGRYEDLEEPAGDVADRPGESLDGRR
jgi:lysyl-tRNA synthetase class 2